MKIEVNSVSILRKLETAVQRGPVVEYVKQRAKNQAELGSISVSEALIAELETHPVARELDVGISANSSFLSRGNLASFFGLPMGLVYSSMNAFRKLMGRPIKITVNKVVNQPRYEVTVSYPPLQSYYDASPAPEEYGGSWLERMETGTLQNFGQFLAGLGFASSRSGGGIQSPTIKKTARTIPHIPFISDIYRRLFGRNGEGKRILTQSVARFR